MNGLAQPRLGFGMRGALAALFSAVALTITAAAASAAAGGQSASTPFQSQLKDGLTLVARQATASPTAALEVWIKCPSNGYAASRPGIARLAALALVEEKIGGSSLREDARKNGGQIGISVYPESTEIAVLAPAYLTSQFLDKLTAQALHPHLSQAAFDSARQRLAAQQVASSEMADQVLRDGLFARMFSNGPLHESTYGNPQALAALSLSDVSGFVSSAYVPANQVVIAVGGVDANDVLKRVAAQAPPARSAQAVPNSTLASFGDNPVSLRRESINSSGAALGWVGPPIADERAATAMDFLSDYLTHQGEGVVFKAVRELGAGTTFAGQYITLRNPGVLVITATGERLEPTIAAAAIRRAVKDTLAAPLAAEQFGRALDVFRTHLLRDVQTPAALADNYGWYFAQDAPAYSPSATDLSLSGDYFAQAASLTPDYVYSVARRYLLATPAVVLLPQGPVHTAGVTP